MVTTAKGGMVYYDPSIGYYYREPVSMFERNQEGVFSERNPNFVPSMATIGGGTSYYKRVPISNRLGQTTYTPPSVDFNTLPRQVPAGVQVYGAGTQAHPYQRPTMPTPPTGTGYRPQFDPTFIQQMLAQRFGNNQGVGIPTAARPTLTPGAVQNFGGYQGQGGLGALRAIANPAPAGGNENAPV